ncbi:MAG: hypothetical protein H7Z41_12410 [Cytophagales bacterium]|nr:hypothetical protein [Armatimonadota bacterium]
MLEAEYLPGEICAPSEAAKAAGYGGGSFYVLRDFVRAVEAARQGSVVSEGTTTPGIHEAPDRTLPGLISQQSIAQDGTWLPVPDSCTGADAGPETARPVPQLEMVFPAEAPLPKAAPTARRIPTYQLRQFQSGEGEATGR